MKGFVKLPAYQTNHLQLQTDLKGLPEVLSWFEKLHQPTINKQIWVQCQLALAEAFTNAVRHAHKEQSPEMPIDIEVKISDRCVEIRVWDYGDYFDLEEKLIEMPKKEDNDGDGGRGLQLMESISDRLSYTRTEDNRNCLLMVKYYDGDKGLSQRDTVDFN